METIVKIDVRKMKADIKAKAEEQLFYKNQRKTVKLVGERKISPSEATWKHQSNRQKLRLMYAAYGIARGRSLQQIEHHKEDEHPLEKHMDSINAIIDKYKVEVQVEQVE